MNVKVQWNYSAVTIHKLLTHLMQLVSFYTPWKHKAIGALMFSGVSKKTKMVQNGLNRNELIVTW